jgi:aminoglycoside 3-N-acetyltransferase I
VPDITITRLDPAHVDLMHQLNALFSNVFDAPDHYAKSPPSDGYLRNWLRRSQNVVLVAHDGDRLAGGLVAYELLKFEQERSEFYIYDLAVDPGFRRQGIATALIEELRYIAAKHSGWVVYVQADYGDDPAIALYTKLGKREDVMHFDMTVAPLGEDQ